MLCRDSKRHRSHDKVCARGGHVHSPPVFLPLVGGMILCSSSTSRRAMAVCILGFGQCPTATTTTTATPSPATPTACLPGQSYTTGSDGVVTCFAAVTSAVPATTTVDSPNGCNNFVGACVVYGTDNPGTTTVYASNTTPSPTSFVTQTTTVYVSATAKPTSACQNYFGACVVYGGGGAGGAQYTTTVYNDGSNTGGNNGNGQGEIGQTGGDSNQGAIGGASQVSVRWARGLTIPLALAGLFFLSRM